jgi:hypothetical protein
VLGEILEILEVQRREREAVREAACRDPRVIYRPWPTALGGGSGQLAPDAGDTLAAGITGLPVSHASRLARLRGPQRRSRVHWMSSPTVTNVTSGCKPMSRVSNAGGTRPLKERDATSVSRTTAPGRGSGKVGVARLGDEGEELVEFLVGLEGIAA